MWLGARARARARGSSPLADFFVFLLFYLGYFLSPKTVRRIENRIRYTAHGIIPEGVAMRGYGTSTAPYASANAQVKAGVSYLMTGCRDQSLFCGIIPVKPGWLVGMLCSDGRCTSGTLLQ